MKTIDESIASTSTAANDSKGHHRRTSSLWVPPTRPIFSSPSQVFREKAENGSRILKSNKYTGRFFRDDPILPPQRVVVPNNQPDPPPRYEHPNRKYTHNRISTTKYSVLTFFPKNLFEQLHRFANLYFIFIVLLNLIIGAYGKYISILPISFVLGVTAIKDAFEDYRRYKSDKKINHSTCRVWDASQKRYRKLEWQNIIVGDFVHLSHDEVIPADILLLKTTDANGVCYVETSNLDGECNLKQRKAIRAMGKYHNSNVPQTFSPEEFKYLVVCEQPTNDVYKFEGKLETVDGGPPLAREFTVLAKENVLLRGCVVKNTDFVEGIVLYAGAETKAMLNNNGPRYKRSSLEKLTNIDVLWCVVILLCLCILGAILTGVWLRNYQRPFETPFLSFIPKEENVTYQIFHWKKEYTYDPSFESWWNFWSYIIVLQVLIPISLYVSIEFIKIGQVWLMSHDRNMYYDKVDKRLQCRALNITEELGQIEYVMSDKTGTLTENQMVFRRCSVNGKDYGTRACDSQDTSLSKVAKDTSISRHNRQLAALAAAEIATGRPRPSRDPTLEALLAKEMKSGDMNDPIYQMFLIMAVCNTVVVNPKPHEDLMDPEGDMINSKFDFDEPETSESNSLQQRPSTVKFLQEVDEREESVSVTSEESEKVNDDDFELIDLGEKKVEEEKPEDVPEEIKGKKGILQRPSLLGLAKLKLKSPFRRSLDKRQSSSSEVSVATAALHSFYDSESPDELALVEAAREYGLRLLKRRFDDVIIYSRHTDSFIKYKVLHTLPFDSDRKRMSVVVRECFGSGRILVLTKGADTSILPILSDDFCTSPEGDEVVFKVQEHLTSYAKEGLRTLCLSRRVWPEDDYQDWKLQHEEAELDQNAREELLQKSYIRAEAEQELLGATAIEDRLQDGVPECINSLRDAGIRVWVLTGDKVETAVNIAYSSRLFTTSMDLLNVGARSIREVSDLIDEHLKRISRAEEVTHNASDNFGLVLNGEALNYCTDPHNEQRFVELLKRCRSILFCRATPLQKAQLVRLAKQKLNGKVLAVGDGANDVSMIQGADVGVGLSGQEGMQAVMASDFAMARFRFLSNLLLVHGHWCYYRLSQTILYFFYKNAMMVFVMFWYQMFCGFSAQVPIDSVYLMVYNLFFTSVPPLLFGCIDQDASTRILLENPSLYAQGRLGKRYRWYSFWVNMLESLYQSAVVFWVCYMTYYGSDCSMWVFGWLLICQLIFVNTAHLALLVQYWTWPMFWSMFWSIGVFFLCALLYNGFVTPDWTWTGVKDTPSHVAEYGLAQANFWFALVVSIILSLLPRFALTALRNTVNPTAIIKKRREHMAKNLEQEKTTKKKSGGFCIGDVITNAVCCCTAQAEDDPETASNVHTQTISPHRY